MSQPFNVENKMLHLMEVVFHSISQKNQTSRIKIHFPQQKFAVFPKCSPCVFKSVVFNLFVQSSPYRNFASKSPPTYDFSFSKNIIL